jgi:poly[(R)-3-hydroxyalkanoate] polymerase subunit PhaE
MNWFDGPDGWLKYWTENQKSLFQAMAEGKPALPSMTFGDAPAGSFEDWTRQMSEISRRSVESWTALAKQGWPMLSGSDADRSSLQQLFDPAVWSRTGAGRFDLALERLTEGPTYATLWDLDRKLLSAQRLWLKRSEDIAAYQVIVQAAWRRAVQHFVEALNDPKALPLKSGREFLDLWIATANACLLVMHRSDAFLEAQRKMTRSATEYRLQEREIAEAFCAMHHIPTRTEMDEVQRAVYELRRELRALQRKGEGEIAQPALAPRSGKRPGAKAKAKAKRKSRRANS